ncbi:hypothetical protein GE09DRAFT_1232593 [Coniochaeta sp. 2T2.1]|nr:hypothetical protein GE09DRAFT_1232593 [Coniochaeta sp. 2T2.1]
MSSVDEPRLYERTKVENHCFLCHEFVADLTQIRKGSAKPFVILYQFRMEDGQDGAVVLRSLPRDPRSPRHAHHARIYAGRNDRRYIFICGCMKDRSEGNRCRNCNPDWAAVIAHAECWAVTEPWALPPTCLGNFALKTRPITLWRTPAAKTKDLRFRPTPKYCGYVTTTHVGSLLERVSELPQEVVDGITVHLSGSLVGSLLKTHRTLQELVPELHLGDKFDPPGNVPVPGSCNHTITSICAWQNRILGQSYISRMAFDAEDAPLRLEIATGAIRGLQVAVSRHGLCALRILYESSPPSPWLGDPSETWMGIVPGSDLSKLMLLHDEFRIIRLEFAGAPDLERHMEPSRSILVTQALWDRDMSWLKQPSYMAAGRTWCNEGLHSEPVIPYYDNWRLCRHLPLVLDSRYARGLTACYTHEGIVGIQAHFHDQASSPSIGRMDDGYCYHLALGVGEYLTSLWKPTRGPYDLWRQPNDRYDSLVITTNRDRTFHLGCTTIRQENWVDGIKWTRVSSSKPPVRITGLVVDAISGNDRPFRDIGITEEEEADHGLGSSSRSAAAIGSGGFPQYPRWDEQLAHYCFFRDYYSGEQTSFMTTASLLDVSRIALQQLPGGGRRRRTLGLRIEHHDGTLDTLGEWDPEYPGGSALVLYDSAFGPLEELVFTLRRAGDAGGSRVVAVSAKVAEEPPPHFAGWNSGSGPGPTGPKVVVRSNDKGIDYHLEYDAGGSDTVLAYAFTFAGELEEDNWYNEVWCFESDPQTGPPPQGGPEELEILI